MNDRIYNMWKGIQKRRLATCIVSAALLFAALLPLIGQAFSAEKTGANAVHEICTMNGIKTVADHAGHQAPENQGLHSEHCPFCRIHADVLALPPVAHSFSPVLGSTSILPELYYQSPHPLFVWATAQSRAPPASS